MGELATSLAHELNQPLTAILSNAQAALRFMGRESVDLTEVREILQDIVQDNSRAGEIIRRMRALVKKEKLEFAPLDLAALIRDVAKLLHSDAILLNVEIVIDAADDTPPVVGDKVQLQQVVLNLLLNAFDAMKESPRDERKVTILMELYGRMIKVSVCDTGPGLTPEKRARLFQPFYTTKLQGLGMGLSICRGIVEAHHGHLWAEDGPIWAEGIPSRRGAVFSFTLPVEEVAQSPSGSQPS
jgi:signal transduction histidine kinase